MIPTFRFKPMTLCLIALMVSMLSLVASGCSDKVGCFAWTEAEGACPSQDEALEYFNPQGCGQVRSVDSDPEYDGEYCCYDITKTSSEYIPCAGF